MIYNICQIYYLKYFNLLYMIYTYKRNFGQLTKLLPSEPALELDSILCLPGRCLLLPEFSLSRTSDSPLRSFSPSLLPCAPYDKRPQNTLHSHTQTRRAQIRVRSSIMVLVLVIFFVVVGNGAATGSDDSHAAQ